MANARPFFLGILAVMALYLSGFFVVLTPLPLFYLLAKDDRKTSLAVIVFSSVILFFLYFFALEPLYALYQNQPSWEWVLPIPGMYFLAFVGPASVLLFGLFYFWFFIALAYALWRILKASKPYRLFMITCLAFWLAGGLLFLVYTALLGKPPQELLAEYFRTAVDQLIKLEAPNLEAYADRFVGYLVLSSPAIWFFSVFLTLALNLILIKRVLSPFFQISTEKISLNDLSIPFTGIWIVIASLALFLANHQWFGIGFFELVSLNALLIMVLLYFFQGLAIVSFYLEKRSVRPFLRVMIYLFIFLFFQVFGIFLVALGFFDAWFDFRKFAVSPKGLSK